MPPITTNNDSITTKIRPIDGDPKIHSPSSSSSSSSSPSTTIPPTAFQPTLVARIPSLLFAADPDHAGTPPTSNPTPRQPNIGDGIISRRRADSSSGSGTKPPQLPHLQINPAKAHHPWPNNLYTPSQSSTAPIAIPQQLPQRPTTPLTGRPTGDESRDFFSFTKALQSSTSYRNTPMSSHRSASPGHQTMGSRAGQQPNYRPSSPLSPSMPIPIPQAGGAGGGGGERGRYRRANRPPQNLNLNTLPKFHPLNFPNSDSNISSSPRSARSITSQPRHSRLGSDAQQQLQQYQRTVIANTTRTAHSTLSQGTGFKPESPRLVPSGSPAGPMTPLMLEAQSQGDYLMAGSGVSGSGSRNGRELVEKLVQKENERRQHPEARSGSLSPSVSPAVSPAGGCG